MPEKNLLIIHTRTPLHAGTGEGLNGIDLPIAREKATSVPYLPGSSIKGTLRDIAGACLDEKQQAAIFGPATTQASEHASAFICGDARLLLLPVRSLAGVFAWVTSPFLLQRFMQDAGIAGLPIPDANEKKTLNISNLNEAWMLQEGQDKLIASAGKIYLEDLSLQAKRYASQDGEPDLLGDWLQCIDPGEVMGLKERLCVVHDDVMSFLMETATEVVARIKMENETKTVANGGLWYEENLPAESLLYSLVMAHKPRSKNSHLASGEAVMEEIDGIIELADNLIQFGGNATVGRGLCRVFLAKSETTSGDTP